MNRTTFFRKPRIHPSCRNVGNFLYDSGNCDEGYWCGCSDPTGIHCLPSNDLTTTQWAGHYTITDKNGKKHVLTGWAREFPTNDYFQCTDSLYCPGSSNTNPNFCPTLCRAGYYCPNATLEIPCPQDHYCLMGSTEPTLCTGLETCNAEGVEIYNASATFAAVMGSAMMIFWALCLISFQLKNQTHHQHNNNNKSLTGTVTAVAQATAKVEKNGDQGVIMRMRESTVRTQSPSQTIDIAFSNLQLTLPNGKCILKGVSGKLNAGSFCAIMGPSGAVRARFLLLLS